MARLHNPGTGEVSDRLTILALKILCGRQQGKAVDHFETEQHALLAMIRTKSLNGSWFGLVLELAAVNGQLWNAEDELRQYRFLANKGELVASGAVMECAFRIQDLNDRRAELVKAINQTAGDHVGGEKI